MSGTGLELNDDKLSTMINEFVQEKYQHIEFFGHVGKSKTKLCAMTAPATEKYCRLEDKCMVKEPNMENYQFSYIGPFDRDELQKVVTMIVDSFKKKLENHPITPSIFCTLL